MTGSAAAKLNLADERVKSVATAISTIQTAQAVLVMHKALNLRCVARTPENVSVVRDMVDLAVTGAPHPGGVTLVVSAASAVIRAQQLLRQFVIRLMDNVLAMSTMGGVNATSATPATTSIQPALIVLAIGRGQLDAHAVRVGCARANPDTKEKNVTSVRPTHTTTHCVSSATVTLQA